jgi:hypothetical protein
VLLALDYTRGIEDHETVWDALKQGAGHVLASKVLSPRLSHFRYVDGASLFPGDGTMTPAFRDSALWGAETNQVGHLLCAVESGMRLAELQKHPVQRSLFDVALSVANRVAGFHHIEGNSTDWSRAGILGHEMRADDDGFVAQMQAYDALVGQDDPHHVRQQWDDAVQAARDGNHDDAFTHIHALSALIDAPSTPAQVEANLADPTPKYATPHKVRDGNSQQDVALSVYGFATGLVAGSTGFATPKEARDHFEALYLRTGRSASAIDEAARGP